MSLSFKAIAKPNPNDQSLAPKHYAQIQYSGRTDLERLSEIISDGSTVREADVYAVLIGLTHAMAQELADGKIVELGKLGSFRISISSVGADNAEELQAKHIKKSRMIYHPSKALKRVLSSLSFKKIA